jgi:hypothetical protein
MLAFSMPASGEEQAPSSAEIVSITAPQQIDLGMWQSQLPVHTLGLRGDNAFQSPAAMQEIRLSRGAKIAIIVVAIVVGVLLITGGIVLASPR